MDYEQVIQKKLRKVQQFGFTPKGMNAKLFGFQKVITEWAVKNGRAALFEDCGLGKTPQQLEYARQCLKHTKKPVLGLCPLAVADQTVREGEKFGIKVNHVRRVEDFDLKGINYTNYDQLENFREVIPELSAIVLDESSILKAFTGKTRRTLTEAFSNTMYRLCNTATPAPNDFAEIGNHAEFLGIMSTQEMLATWFINDTANTGEWRLKKHAATDFWEWVATWAACVSKPSDIGFDDDGFVLPKLNLIPVWVEVDVSGNEDGELIRADALSASTMNAEMRRTITERCGKVAELVASDKDKWAVWCNLNAEQDELEKHFNGQGVSIRGADSPDAKTKGEVEWRTGSKQVMISKGSIFGYGMNWAHCKNTIIFPSFSFEDFYQIARRFYRYGQTREVNCYLVLPKTGQNILRSLQRKMEQHREMHEMMQFSAKALTNQKLQPKMNTAVEKKTGERWEMYHGDCVRAIKNVPDNAAHFSVFSPPFADLFVYSSDIQDMGNNSSLDDFMEQFSHLVKELYRVTQPGRECAVHCVDLMATKWKDGDIELKNFSKRIVEAFCGDKRSLVNMLNEQVTGAVAGAFEENEWLFHTRITIWKDPVVEMQRTKALGLLHKQLIKDSTMSRVGSPEYILVFRKPGKNETPVTHTREGYPVDQWQKDASPVWMDINQTNVLNGKLARENQDERHICPLQLDVINRLLKLYTNEGEVVLSPFAGIGSEGYCAVNQKRRFIGMELKKSYFDTACNYLQKAAEESIDLFTLT
jgi:hypothetical protein